MALRAAGDERSARNFERFMRGSVVETPLFHGTDAAFDTFKRGEMGFHFSGEPYIAPVRRVQSRANPTQHKPSANLMPVYVNIKKPLRVDDPGNWGTGFVYDLNTKGILSDKEAEALITTMRRSLGKLSQSNDAYEYTRPIREALESKGYDGIVYHNAYEGGGDSFIAFRPNQIKSATGNRGSFNKKKASIVLSGAAAAGLGGGAGLFGDTVPRQER